MKLCVSIDIAGSPDAILDYLHSDEYLSAASDSPGVLRVEREELREDGDSLVVATRWFAPTKLPRILKKYEGRAPESVNWLERMEWDIPSRTAQLTVDPDVPESWRSKYSSSGTIQLEETPSGSRLTQELEFEMKFGMIGKALEKLLKNEVEALLKQRLEILRTHFG